MPEQYEHGEADARRKEAHRKAIIASELWAKIQIERKKLTRLEKKLKKLSKK